MDSWDLIETYQILTRKVDYAGNVFNVGRSGSKINTNVQNDICRLRQSFLSDRIKNYWNKLPAYVKFSGSVTSFKMNLDKFKFESVYSSSNNFWEVSDLIINKIEGNPNYMTRKEKFNSYLLDNPFVACRKGINIYSY